MQAKGDSGRAVPWLPIMRFGAFELDLRAGELRKYGLRIRLQDQPLQILLMLLEHPGEIVAREQIRQRLWADGTIVDFDHSINAAIKRLRDVLGESADRPRYIETKARAGYRFIGEVSGTIPARAGKGAESACQVGPAIQPILVGREQEQTALSAALASASGGRGRLVCVSGEPGIGKTALVEAFLARSGEYVLVGHARCSERLSGTEAWLPWLEVLESLLGGAAPAEPQTSPWIARR